MMLTSEQVHWLFGATLAIADGRERALPSAPPYPERPRLPAAANPNGHFLALIVVPHPLGATAAA